MAKIYKHLTTQERAVIMTMRADLCSTRSIAKRLCRSASTISRELARTNGSGTGDGSYDADLAHAQCHARRLLPRRLPKLHTDSALFLVAYSGQRDRSFRSIVTVAHELMLRG